MLKLLLSLASFPHQNGVLFSISFVEYVGYSKIAEQFDFAMFYADLGVAEDQKIVIVGDWPFASE